MLVIASEESALVQVHIYISTEVTCNSPVCTETTELNIKFTVFGVPLVISVVCVGGNLVVALAFDGVAKSRAENAQVDYSFKAF